MKRLFFICALALSPLAYGAVQKDPMLMKETFRNNYGIIVSKQEWNKRGCDGSITRVFKDGTTTLEVYAQGALHGEVTRTFPHSTTLAVIETYDQGRLLSKKTFFPNALPAKEEVYHEDGSFSLTRWPDNNNSDTITDPCFVEKTYGGRVLEGHYTSFNGKYSSTILNGEGVRSTFSSDSILLTEESFNDGVMVKKRHFTRLENPKPSLIMSMGTLTEFGLPIFLVGFQIRLKNGDMDIKTALQSYLKMVVRLLKSHLYAEQKMESNSDTMNKRISLKRFLGSTTSCMESVKSMRRGYANPNGITKANLSRKSSLNDSALPDNSTLGASWLKSSLLFLQRPRTVWPRLALKGLL